MKTRTFWSPCHKYLVSAYVGDRDITLLDDNGTVWAPTNDVLGGGESTPSPLAAAARKVVDAFYKDIALWNEAVAELESALKDEENAK